MVMIRIKKIHTQMQLCVDREELNYTVYIALTVSCRVSEGCGGVPSRVEDPDSDVITSSTPQTTNSIAVLASWELSTGSSLGTADSCQVC